jgi:hypothetical protein
VIPIWLIPWKAKAEIKRLTPLSLENDDLKQELSQCRDMLGMAHAESARLIREHDVTREKLAHASKWITLTHGLSGLRVVEGRTVDILKKAKIENKNDLHIVLPPVG